MDKEKSILAQNLITLRKSKKLTQLELAEKLNYSDKTVSKWENGDAVPDLETLLQLSKFYEVTLDELCKTAITVSEAKKQIITKNKIIIICLSVLAVWSIAIFGFFEAQVMNKTENAWLIFLWASPATFLVIYLLALVWKHKLLRAISASALVWTCAIAAHVRAEFLGYSKFWILYILMIPIQAAIVLFSQLDTGNIKYFNRKNDKELAKEETDIINQNTDKE